MNVRDTRLEIIGSLSDLEVSACNSPTDALEQIIGEFVERDYSVDDAGVYDYVDIEELRRSLVELLGDAARALTATDLVNHMDQLAMLGGRLRGIIDAMAMGCAQDRSRNALEGVARDIEVEVEMVKGWVIGE